MIAITSSACLHTSKPQLIGVFLCPRDTCVRAQNIYIPFTVFIALSKNGTETVHSHTFSKGKSPTWVTASAAVQPCSYQCWKPKQRLNTIRGVILWAHGYLDDSPASHYCTLVGGTQRWKQAKCVGQLRRETRPKKSVKLFLLNYFFFQILDIYKKFCTPKSVRMLFIGFHDQPWSPMVTPALPSSAYNYRRWDLEREHF